MSSIAAATRGPVFGDPGRAGRARPRRRRPRPPAADGPITRRNDLWRATMTTVTRSTPATATSVSGATLNLAMATTGFLLNFWAWALLGPLGPGLKESLGLSFASQSLLVAVPVLVGSVGRIPVGALTDRFGARVMFPLVSAITIVPVLFLGLAGHSSLAALLAGGFFLGVGG